MHRFTFLVILAVMLGCGESGPKLAKTRGIVTYKKVPLKFGSVVFQPEKGKLARGSIQPDGSFELTTNSSGDGAVLGKHRIRVVCNTNQDPSLQKGAVKEGEEMPAGKSLIPDKYGDLERTPLKEEVKDIDQNNFTFDLVD